MPAHLSYSLLTCPLFVSSHLNDDGIAQGHYISTLTNKCPFLEYPYYLSLRHIVELFKDFLPILTCLTIFICRWLLRATILQPVIADQEFPQI